MRPSAASWWLTLLCSSPTACSVSASSRQSLDAVLGYVVASPTVAVVKTALDLSVSSLQHSPSNIVSACNRECPQTLHVLSSHGPKALKTGPPFHVTKTPLWCSQKPGTKKMHKTNNNHVLGPLKAMWGSEEIWVWGLCGVDVASVLPKGPSGLGAEEVGSTV